MYIGSAIVAFLWLLLFTGFSIIERRRKNRFCPCNFPFDNRYFVYLDVTYIAVRHEMVSKEMIYIAVGIHEDGSKEVLAYTTAPTESAYK